MENQELIEAIKNCGVKKSQIEADLGMPKNSLSAMLSGVKPMPSKWVDALTGYVNGSTMPKEVPEQKETVELMGSYPISKEKPEIRPEPAVFVPNPISVPKGVNFALGSDLLKSTPKSTFQLMLIEFNGLVMEQPPVSQVKNQLLHLLKSAEHPEFTIRQVEAIRERCINYLNGTYGVSAKKDSYNNAK
jgi:hypothetical protein